MWCFLLVGAPFAALRVPTRCSGWGTRRDPARTASGTRLRAGRVWDGQLGSGASLPDPAHDDRGPVVGFDVVRNVDGRANSKLAWARLGLPLPESAFRLLSIPEPVEERNETGPSSPACDRHKEILYWQVNDNEPRDLDPLWRDDRFEVRWGYRIRQTHPGCPRSPPSWPACSHTPGSLPWPHRRQRTWMAGGSNAYFDGGIWNGRRSVRASVIRRDGLDHLAVNLAGVSPRAICSGPKPGPKFLCDHADSPDSIFFPGASRPSPLAVGP